MRRSFLVLFGILLVLTSLTSIGLFAQSESVVRAMRRIPLSGSDQLDRTLADPGVGVIDKVQAVIRLGELTEELRLAENKQFPASRLFNPLLGVLTPQRDVQDHHVLREEACKTLVRFSTIEGSDQLVVPLGKVVQSHDEHARVRLAAAQTLGRFTRDAAAASDQLVPVLTHELDRGPTGDNVELTTAVVIALGNLQDKRSFVVLMRVVQSRFPNHTKRTAQTALESIRWQ